MKLTLCPGINFSFAKLLVSRGCNVVIADLALRPEAAEFVAQHTGADGSPRAVFTKTDVTNWDELAGMFESALTEFGDYDVFCPGAGVYEPEWSSFWQPPGSPESRDAASGNHYKLLDINLTHPIRSTQMAISQWMYPRASTTKFPTPKPVSLENPKRIVHVSSIAGQIPVFRAPLYGASKFAVTGFVRCLAPLESTGIRVTAVAPGLVLTPLWTESPQSIMNVDPEKDKWVTPDEVADVMLRCVEREPAGTILEVGSKIVRTVEAFNDPGPDRNAQGYFASNSNKGDDNVWELLRNQNVWG